MLESSRVGRLQVMAAVVLVIVAACGDGSTTETSEPADASTTTAAPTTDATATVVVTVSPNQGPSGTNATVTVKGEPNQIVIVQVNQPNGFEYQLSGTTDTNGDYSATASFSGQVGDVITVTAIVGPQQDSPSSSTTFTITGDEPPTTTSSAPTTTTQAPTTTAATSTTATVAAIEFSQGSVTGTISPGAAAVGQAVNVSACGFLPGEVVEWFYLGLIEVRAADAGGCVTISFTVPNGTPSGGHPMDLSGDQGTYVELMYEVL